MNIAGNTKILLKFEKKIIANTICPAKKARLCGHNVSIKNVDKK